MQHQFDTALAQQVHKNGECLLNILKVIVVCDKQNTALRGHCDDQRHLEQHGNHSNFHALFLFRVEPGGVTLKNHLEHNNKAAAEGSKYFELGWQPH